MIKEDELEVTQEDRSAATTWIWEHVVSDPLQSNVLKGEWIIELVQAFARHRLNSTRTVPQVDGGLGDERDE